MNKYTNSLLDQSRNSSRVVGIKITDPEPDLNKACEYSDIQSYESKASSIEVSKDIMNNDDFIERGMNSVKNRDKPAYQLVFKSNSEVLIL